MRFAIIEQDWNTELWETHDGVRPVKSPEKSGTFHAVCEQDSVAALVRSEGAVGPSAEVGPEGLVRLVVFQSGASWPSRLAGVLSGGATTCIVVATPLDSAAALTERVVYRVQQAGQVRAQMVWVTAEERDPHELELATALAARCGATEVLFVVPSGSKRSYLTSRSNVRYVGRAVVDNPGLVQGLG